jgi:hypothetical protein
MKTSEQIEKLATALAAAQGEFRNPPRNSSVTVQTKTGARYSFTYTSLDGIFDVIRPVMTKHGLALVQPIGKDDDGRQCCITRIIHTSGQWIETPVPLKVEGDGNQAFGSALTYARRYGITSLLAIASDEDDDANAADGNSAEKASVSGESKASQPAAHATPAPSSGKTDSKVPVDQKTLTSFGGRLLLLCDGDKARASDLLVKLTKTDKWEGHTSIRNIKWAFQLERAERELGKYLGKQGALTAAAVEDVEALFPDDPGADREVA